ncbi:sugar phosphate isomerase/epimerase family protein [Candidatus Poribacteria bacterium]
MKENEIGVFLSSMAISDPLEAIEKARELGLDVVQIGALPDEFYNNEGIERLRRCLQENGLRASAVCAVYTGEDYSDMAAVAETVGLTNPEMLQERMAHTKRCADLADSLGAGIVTTHIGVMSEDTDSSGYKNLLDTVREIADYCGSRGLVFAMETGQETAEAMLQFIKDTGRNNVKVNFDPANMVLYGTGGPLEAVEVLRDHIAHVHVKDGLSPTQQGGLGTEVPLSQGEVNIREYIRKLADIGYSGPLVIEREAGNDRTGDIARGRKLLEKILSELP